MRENRCLVCSAVYDADTKHECRYGKEGKLQKMHNWYCAFCNTIVRTSEDTKPGVRLPCGACKRLMVLESPREREVCDRCTRHKSDPGFTLPCPEHGLSEGAKYDKDKVRLDLLPSRAIHAVGDVLTYGAKKYAPNNWQKVKGWRWRYMGAALRHLFAYLRGDKIDPESELPHLAHAACCILFMLELDALSDTHGDET